MPDEPRAGAARALTPPATHLGPSVGTVVREVAALLDHARIPMAAQEARDIVAILLDQPRFWPSVHRDARIDPETHAAALAAAAARVRGAPFAYAVGRAPFRHLTLDVDPRVLIPRQETEQLVEIVLELSGAGGGTVVDVGTGSGAIAFALATEGRFARVVATDISADALAVARRNAVMLADALTTPVELRQGALLAPVRDLRARAIVSNPPYVAYAEAAALPASVRDWEPCVALFSGSEGLAATAAIVREAAELLEPGGLLALEVDSRRAMLVAELAAAHGRYRDIHVRLDLTGRERFVVATRER